MLIAKMLRKRYGVSDVPTDEQLLAMCEGEGVLLVEDLPPIGDLREIYVEGTLALRPGQSRDWRRWLIAHGIVHHLCHSGNQVQRSLRRLSLTTVRRQEREADYEAGLIMWHHMLDWRGFRRGDTALSVWQLAEIAEVPVAKVLEWREINHALPQMIQQSGALVAIV